MNLRKGFKPMPGSVSKLILKKDFSKLLISPWTIGIISKKLIMNNFLSNVKVFMNMDTSPRISQNPPQKILSNNTSNGSNQKIKGKPNKGQSSPKFPS
jgi:hypothetical protein